MTEEEAFQCWWQNEWKFGSSTDEAKARRAWTAARTAKCSTKELDELTVDQARCGEHSLTGPTGIYVRAMNPHGKWISADITTLDRESLIAWLRSRGGINEWAENTVLLMLGHGTDD